jgi:hypothetical protein
MKLRNKNKGRYYTGFNSKKMLPEFGRLNAPVDGVDVSEAEGETIIRQLKLLGSSDDFVLEKD